MSNMYRIIVVFVLVILVVGCATPSVARPTLLPTDEPTVSMTVQPTASILPEPQIVRHPEPLDLSRNRIYTSPPIYDSQSGEQWQVDLRSSDLSRLDLSKSGNDLLYADFDSKTKWPTSDKMPGGFDWQKIMELNKDPGLGMRALHEQGITGKGVSIAMIDQTLLVDHIEYKDRLRLYEEMQDLREVGPQARMHGPAVASIAVGKSVGVAPDSELYYIAAGFCGATSFQEMDFSCWARAVGRIVEINKDLPADRKIRVLSLSWGWLPQDKGYEEIDAAINAAKAAGIFVISSSLRLTDNLNFHGLGRYPLSDPNDFWSYKPGLWWEKDFYKHRFSNETLLVPMDSRTTASPTGTEDYVFYREGGWSWAIPYLAGMYALTVQVKPDITPQQFWQAALDTGRTIHVGRNGKDFEFGVILDPQALIKEIQSK